MNKNNFRTLFVKTAGFLGVASFSVLLSLPGFSQQSPDNTSPSVPSTVKPTNLGGRDAGTTNGGENLNRVPSNNSTTQQNNSTGQSTGTPDGGDPTSRPDATNRVEGRGQTSPQRNTSSPGNNSSQPGANQPGSTNGGDSVQQVEQNQNGGSTTQQNQTTPQGGYQTSPRPRTQSDTNSGSSTDGTTSQQQPANGSVRALW